MCHTSKKVLLTGHHWKLCSALNTIFTRPLCNNCFWVLSIRKCSRPCVLILRTWISKQVYCFAHGHIQSYASFQILWCPEHFLKLLLGSQVDRVFRSGNFLLEMLHLTSYFLSKNKYKVMNYFHVWLLDWLLRQLKKELLKLFWATLMLNNTWFS